MGIKCQVCETKFMGTSGLHLGSCSQCGNEDISKFVRIDDEDINPSKYKSDKEWLESRLIK